MSNKNEMPFADVLQALFTSPNLPVHLVHRLSDLTDDQVAHFAARWPAVDEERRGELMRHMADIAEDNYVVDFSPIFTHLFSDAAASVRLAALDGIWDSTDTDLIDPIIGMMQRDQNLGVRAAAARALSHFVLLAEWGQIAPVHSERIVKALLAEYERPTASEDVRRAALEAMSAANTPRINELIMEAYETGSFDMQLSAIFAMGGTADKVWVPLLIDELESPSADFRAEAARACGSIGDTDAVTALEQLLADEEREVTMAAILALGQIGGDQATGILNDLLEDPDFEDLYDVIEESLEEMDWGAGGLDMLSFGNYDDDDDDELDVEDEGDDDNLEGGIYLN